MIDNSIIKSDVNEILKSINLSDLNNKSILITGASGLVGTYLLFVFKAFILNGGNPESITAISKNTIPNHLLELTYEDKFNFIKGDLTCHDFLESLGNYDVIIHAAGYGQPQKFMADSISTIRLNSYTTDVLTTKVKKNGKFIYLSSSELYTGSNNSPSKISDIGNTSPYHHRAPYIEGKRIGETISLVASKAGLNLKIIRLSLIFGPGFKKDDTRVLYQFINMASNGVIQLLDDGKVSRTYCYISDGIELILKIMLFGKEILYNVGGHSKISIIEIANHISKRFNSKIVHNDKKNELNSPNSVEIDVSLTEQEFNKINYINFDEGLDRTIKWFNLNLK